MPEICESQVDVEQLRPAGFCDACLSSFITRVSAIKVALVARPGPVEPSTPPPPGSTEPPLPTRSVEPDSTPRAEVVIPPPPPPTFTKLLLLASLRYRICLRPIGFGLGKHLYSTTLVPGEEIEIEVFRSAKVVEELSRELSVEETFSQEFSATLQDEWSRKENSNFKIGGGVSASLDLGIFQIGARAEPEYSTQEETFQKTVSEYIAKSQAKTDRKFDLHVDLKTETVATTRSTRKLRNFNQCQPVTYNFFQLMCRMRLDVVIDALTFDVVDETKAHLHPLFAAPLGGLLQVARFTPPRPQELLGTLSGGAFARNPEEPAAAAAPTSPLLAQATVQHAFLAEDFNRPVRELTFAPSEPSDQLRVEVLAHLTPDLRRSVRELAARLIQQFPVGKVVHSEELCVNTPSTTVEAFTGRCLACDTHTALVLEAEREKLRGELIQGKLARAASAAVFGFVRSVAGPVLGAVVRLKRGSTVLGQTVTDGDGLYMLFAKGLAVASEELTAEVVDLPGSLQTAAPSNATFKPADVPVQLDFFAF